jgi:tRNA nucleotidyltransferase (CCA-adding enzyme)
LHQLTKQELNNFCKRLKAPAKYQKLASLGITYKDLFQKADKLSAEEILGLLEKLDAFRKPERFHDFLSAEEAIFNYDNKFSIEHQKLGEAFNKSSKIDIKKLIADQELSGEEIKNIVHKARLARIEE